MAKRRDKDRPPRYVRPLTKMSQAATSPMVTIAVQGGKIYYINKSIITSVSKYFKAALEGNFTEAHQKRVNLPDVNPVVFDIFIDWIFTSDIEVLQRNIATVNAEYLKHPRTSNIREIEDFIGQQLLEVHIFADAHEIPDLLRLTLDESFRFFTGTPIRLPSRKSINFAFENLPEGAPYLRLLVDLCCRYNHLDTKDLAEAKGEMRDLSREFVDACLLRYSVVMKELTEGRRELGYELNICDYHGHEELLERKDCAAARVVRD